MLLKSELTTSYVLPFPLLAAAEIMAFWLPNINPAVWITVFFLVPITFNFFNVRKYGELEYWLTSVKVVACVGIIILGILLPMDASTSQPLLGTNNVNGTLQLIPCLNSTTDDCVPQPGFSCICRIGSF